MTEISARYLKVTSIKQTEQTSTLEYESPTKSSKTTTVSPLDHDLSSIATEISTDPLIMSTEKLTDSLTASTAVTAIPQLNSHTTQVAIETMQTDTSEKPFKAATTFASEQSTDPFVFIPDLTSKPSSTTTKSEMPTTAMNGDLTTDYGETSSEALKNTGASILTQSSTYSTTQTEQHAVSTSFKTTSTGFLPNIAESTTMEQILGTSPNPTIFNQQRVCIISHTSAYFPNVKSK